MYGPLPGNSLKLFIDTTQIRLLKGKAEVATIPVAAITEIYAYHVLHGAGSFEIEAPDAEEMARLAAATCGAISAVRASVSFC